MTAPIGVPDRLWVVIVPGGQRHYLDRVPTEGMTIEEWAKGLNVTIREYEFRAVVHRPSPEDPKPAKEKTNG